MSSERQRKLCVPITLAALVWLEQPLAYDLGPIECNGLQDKIPSKSLTLEYSTATFSQTEIEALEAAARGWTDFAPELGFSIAFVEASPPAQVAKDNHSTIVKTPMSPRGTATPWHGTGTNCWKVVEVDIEIDTSPAFNLDDRPEPLTEYPNSLVENVLHELGHAFRLEHEDNVLSTMSASMGDAGGPLGSYNIVQPHADDLAGMRALYGSTSLTDVAATSYEHTTGGADPGGNPISPPTASLHNGDSATFKFTIENRGTTAQSPSVRFVLSNDAIITTSDEILTNATYSIGAATALTTTRSIEIPDSVDPGNYYFGYLVDQNNQIAEFDDSGACQQV